ncbi:MAG TPA: ABC transporter ATP-binding protein [Verrucomicrobiae bacterium]|jgi:ATP-binding cassette subfamily B protein/subfamily B ATP-binding cassette protein MsbA
MKDFARALKYFRQDAGRIASILFLMLVSTGLNALKPWPLAVIVDSVLGEKPAAGPLIPGALAQKSLLLGYLSLAIFILYVLQAAVSSALGYLSIQVSLRGLTRARDELFGKLLGLSARFHQGATVGDLIYRSSWDTYSFQTLFQQGLVTLLASSVSLLMIVAVMVRLNIPLTLVAVGLAPLLVISIRSFARPMRDRTTAAQKADSRVTALVQQNITALALTQGYTREDFERERFHATTLEAQSRRLSQHGVELGYSFATASVFGLGVAITTWIGAGQVEVHLLTIGQLFVFLSYLAQLYEPLNQLSHVGATIAGAIAGSRRVFEILDTPDEINEQPNTVTPDAQRLKTHGREIVAFHSVTFGYEANREVLRDITFTLKSGESVAIIGPSGVGKTTLLHLFPRFFDPTQGRIELDGVDLRKLKLKELRANVSMVMQEPIILPATVAENIAYGKPGASRSEIEAAARAANADGFIAKLPQSYDAQIGEGGARLSAGERQRINLARAFLKDAPILLLDEPTSALDAESESLISESIEALVRGRTTLIVAHRPGTIARVRRVMVLEAGRLTEIGTPDELRAREGYYARVMQA